MAKKKRQSGKYNESPDMKPSSKIKKRAKQQVAEGKLKNKPKKEARLELEQELQSFQPDYDQPDWTVRLSSAGQEEAPL